MQNTNPVSQASKAAKDGPVDPNQIFNNQQPNSNNGMQGGDNSAMINNEVN